MSAESGAVPKEMMSEVENFSADKLKKVEKAEKDSPALQMAKMQKEIAKGADLKKTETTVKEFKPTAEDIKAEKEGN